jgi:antitoxin component YwqK of YwqJK toxin-antitoxin module
MWTEYDEQGKLLAIRNFSHGKAEGKWKTFHRNGGVKFEGTFLNDKKQGNCMVGRKRTFKIQ